MKPKRAKRRLQESQDEPLGASCNALLKTLAMRCPSKTAKATCTTFGGAPMCMYACTAFFLKQFLRPRNFEIFWCVLAECAALGEPFLGGVSDCLNLTLIYKGAFDLGISRQGI